MKRCVVCKFKLAVTVSSVVCYKSRMQNSFLWFLASAESQTDPILSQLLSSSAWSPSSCPLCLTLSPKPFVWRQLVCKLCDSAVYVKYCYVWLALGIPHIKCCHDVQKVAHKRISFLNVSINALVAPIMEQAFCNSWSCDLLSRTHWFSHW